VTLVRLIASFKRLLKATLFRITSCNLEHLINDRNAPQSCYIGYTYRYYYLVKMLLMLFVVSLGMLRCLIVVLLLLAARCQSLDLHFASVLFRYSDLNLPKKRLCQRLGPTPRSGTVKNDSWKFAHHSPKFYRVGEKS